MIAGSLVGTLVGLVARAGATPLDPSGAEARSALRRELVRPEYHQQNVLEQIVAWLLRLVDRGIAAAAQAPPLSAFAAMLVGLLLVVGLGWLLSRARRTARVDTPTGAVLTDETITADQLRARAEAALAEGRPAAAVVDGFRALTVRQVEGGQLDDTPGATAHEVAAALGAIHPVRRDRVDASARLFDAVLYGDRPATADQARAVLGLDDELAGKLAGLR